MVFQIHKRFKLRPFPAYEASSEVLYCWTLDRKDGTPLVRSGRDDFETEKEARSDIAEARRTLKGASFAKVLSPQDRTS